MTLARRTVRSVGWNAAANAVKTLILLARSILLARWLPVAVFGVYGGADALVSLTVTAAAFGMGGAFLHRNPHTADERQAAAVHFTLKLGFTAVWALLMLGGAWRFTGGADRLALSVLVLANAGLQLAQTPQLIYQRRVEHRRLALTDLAGVLLGTLAALALAWRGHALWALLAVDLAMMAAALVGLYLWRPVWRPRLVWAPQAMRYFLRFGRRNFTAVALWQALDRVDDLWTRLFLGEVALGYYSRAYRFAIYPRLLFANPLNAVATGLYAALHADRPRLSRAFMQTNGLLVRLGFWAAGGLALVAPEFISLVLGEKWLPMLDAFRLMLLFTLLDPLKLTIANLFVAVGRPEQAARVRAVQLAALLLGLFTLGSRWGITGVALAVNLMLLLGIGLLLWLARAHVDFSLTRLFAAPLAALALGAGLAWAGLAAFGGEGLGLALTAVFKLLFFSLGYLLLIFLLERRQTLELLRALRRAVLPERHL
jgi:O-antigen/teichoic acid export membrane protein